jgi:hypothetical protein
MSWFSKNYEKAALGGAAVLALGLAYFGWSKLSGVEDDFNTNLIGAGNNNSAVASADLIPKALQSMKLDRAWKQALDGERPVDLFTGIALFIKSSEPETPVDLLKDAPVHAPIPNTWWLEHRLDPGFADSPTRDPDADGFSNLDEFNSKTNPNNPKSHPEPIAKLMYVKDQSLVWALRPGYGSNGEFPFSYKDNKRQENKMPAGEMVKPGALFFPKGPMAERFKLLGSEVRKEIARSTNAEMEITYVRIEDQKENKTGTVYEIPAPLSEARLNEFRQFDRSAVLSLEALGMSGKEFSIEENTAFALPPSAPKKDYLLKKVTPESIVVEYSDLQGARTTVEINKGSMPRLTE